MAAAALLLLTQCRKQADVAPDKNIVSMTITACSSRTDIGTAGGIVWSANDKIYVSDGANYKGCLTIVDGVGFPSGTFTGTLTDVPDGKNEFRFFYLGQGNGAEPAAGDEEVNISFATQDITASDGKLTNAMRHHVGQGRAEATVTGGVVSGLNVTLTSIVAIAYFKFQDEAENPYTGAITLSGDHIYNSMTLNADGTFTGTKGGISLTNTTSAEKYVMLVPPATVAPETLDFTTGSLAGSSVFENGIEGNKFYRMHDGTAIPVTLEAIPSEGELGTISFGEDDWVTIPGALNGRFTVNSSGTKVRFSQGNLQYLGSGEDGTSDPVWRFAEHQYDYMSGGIANVSPSRRGNVSIDGYNDAGTGNTGYNNDGSNVGAARDYFCWGTSGWNGAGMGSCYQPYSTSMIAANYGPVGEYNLTGDFANADWGVYNTGYLGSGWRVLSKDEWVYLLNADGSKTDYRQDANRFAKARVNDVNGLIIFPDGYNGGTTLSPLPTGVGNINNKGGGFPESSIDAAVWTAMEDSGVVFLPVAGYRYGQVIYNEENTSAHYWTSTCRDEELAFFFAFSSSNVNPKTHSYRSCGCNVRLVRIAD